MSEFVFRCIWCGQGYTGSEEQGMKLTYSGCAKCGMLVFIKFPASFVPTIILKECIVLQGLKMK